jgi:hypothetical protein
VYASSFGVIFLVLRKKSFVSVFLPIPIASQRQLSRHFVGTMSHLSFFRNTASDSFSLRQRTFVYASSFGVSFLVLRKKSCVSVFLPIPTASQRQFFRHFVGSLSWLASSFLKNFLDMLGS